MIEKYKEAFQEEAREVLLDLESALLELNERRDDPELVGRSFRALHTIKGSGAMFGFDEVSAFTHHIENAFDEVRSGRISATADLVNLALAAADHIKIMLDEAAGQGRADKTKAAEILAKLGEFTGALGASAPKSAPKATASVPVPAGSVCCAWRLSVHPQPDFLRNGANPMLLFRELRQMGNLEIKADTSAVPPINELDPQRCYISWEMVLTTGTPLAEIRDVFIFVEDSCEFTIEPVSAAPLTIEPPAAALLLDKQPEEVARTPEKEMHASSIRVTASKLDQLVDLVGQLVTVQARLGEIATHSEDRDLLAVAEDIEGLTAELRENSMGMRTLPLRSTFERFKRLVYDLGRNLQKDVELTFDGGDTELDKTVIDQLNDPLMHLIRNSMDHGIELPDARRAAGKRPTARLQLAARHAGAQVLISVSDDGKGIDQEAVRAKAIERGLIAADAQLSESEVFSLILKPGFSTARQVSNVSGRGVGMDVVKRNIDALRGSIEIASQPGVGSTVTLRLPLTLAIIDGLLVRVGQARFIMPLANTVECVELTRQDIEQAGGKHLANIRGEIVPYIRLSEYLRIPAEHRDREQVMVAETEHGRFGFVVDQVLGDHQTVIKNLGRLYRNVQVISGATILGDGTVALILDLHRLVQSALRATTHNQHLHALPTSGGVRKNAATA